MTSNTPDRSSTFFLAGLLAGAMAGSMLALLLTPRSGRDLRDSLGFELKRMALRGSRLDLRNWGELAEEENRRNLVENIERIRAAGL